MLFLYKQLQLLKSKNRLITSHTDILNIQFICELILLLHEHGSVKEQILLKGHTAVYYYHLLSLCLLDTKNRYCLNNIYIICKH